jgi:predicted AAA+ superfamily ATPase
LFVAIKNYYIFASNKINRDMILENHLKQIAELQKNHILINSTGLHRGELSEIRLQNSFATVISGIRRCGKSTLLFQLLKQDKENVFFLNFDDPRLFDFERNDFERLDKIIAEGGFKKVFFDEIQIIPEWERYVRQKLDEKISVVVTSSNASLLSRELGTKLTGRNLMKELFPFSFAEYCAFENKKPSADMVNDYFLYGGFPEYVSSKNEEVLLRLLNDILTRDIAVRYGVRDFRTLQRLTLFLLTNVGRLITANKLKTQFEVGATSTILEYLSHLETSYLLFIVPKFSYSIKKQDINPKKVYAIDTGLVNVNSLSFREDIGQKFENLIYLHLRRKNNEIYYFSEKNECDFVVFEKGKIASCIQVCYMLNNDNLKREIDGMVEALEFFEKNEGFMVTLEQKDTIKKNGKIIHVVPAHDFLC